MQYHGVDISQEQIAVFCQKHGIARLSLFGSILREDFSPDSDIDVLVEFAPDVQYSMFDLGGIYMDLREMFGRNVDLKTPHELSRHFRDDILRTARSLYAA